MCFVVLIFSVLITILEVRLLGVIAQTLGASNMWLLMIGTGVVGYMNLKDQRRQSARLQEKMMRGELSDPSDLMLPFVSLLSGLLLMIPGPLTDLTGLALLYPPIGRMVLKRLLKGGLQAAMRGGQGGFGGFGGFGGQGGQGGFGGFGGFGGQGGQGGFGGFGGFGGQGGQSGGAGDHQGDYGPDEIADATFDPHLNDEPPTSSSREGVHPTKRPRGKRWSDQRDQGSARSEARARQVIIDVEGEIIDDD